MEYTAEIYLIKNKQNNKCYIGQAQKFIGRENKKWGTIGRWKSHLREALKTKNDHCILLNQAIRKYGIQNFEVSKICDCNQTNIDNLEIHYIKQFNSLVPTGYNLKTGGANGKDSLETREKKRLMRLGKTHSESTKNNISKGQLGNRRDKKKKIS